MAERIRLDIALEQRGLTQSRARARVAILRGTVSVDGVQASKPGQLVGESERIEIDDPASAYVSRAALKLVAGLDAGTIEMAGKTLPRPRGLNGRLFAGAGRARGGEDLCGRCRARAVARARAGAAECRFGLEGPQRQRPDGRDVPEPIDLLVCDISFVSVTKVLTAPLALCRAGADAVILIKPQFEVGREHIGKGGIVSDAGAIDERG